MKISIIIPCQNKTASIENLLGDIEHQKIDHEVEIVRVNAVSPSGKARNTGAMRADGDVFIFMDNDISLGQDKLLARLVQAVTNVSEIGICGVSQLIPRESNIFQHRCAREILHTEHPVVNFDKESGMIPAACCAVRREVFEEVGGFHSELLRGVDVEFSFRVHAKGYRLIMLANAWIYHPPPENMKEFCDQAKRNGYSTAYIDRFHSELNFDIGTNPSIRELNKKNKLQRAWRFFQASIKAIFKGRWLDLVYRAMYTYGYAKGRLFAKK